MEVCLSRSSGTTWMWKPDVWSDMKRVTTCIHSVFILILSCQFAFNLQSGRNTTFQFMDEKESQVILLILHYLSLNFNRIVKLFKK